MQTQLHAIDPSLRPTSSSSATGPLNQQYQDNNHYLTQSHPPPQAQVQGLNQAYSPTQPSPSHSHQNNSTPTYYGQSSGFQDSPDEQSPNNAPAGAELGDLKRPRACEACRQLKVKCEIDDSSATGSCKRCAKARRQCIITLPSRKRQKKTDSRVAELEKKIDALTASLAARGGSESDTAIDPAIAQHNHHRAPNFPEQWPGSQSQSPPQPAQTAGAKRKSSNVGSPFGGELHKQQITGNVRPLAKPGVPVATPHGLSRDLKQPQHDSQSPNSSRDIITRGLIDTQNAYKCFDRYHFDMSQHLPGVVFPSGTTAEHIRMTKPTLFHAVVAVACGTILPDVQSNLISDATRILADKIVYSGEKSLELIQTIQILTVFYQPPDKYEELNFNQLIHIAAVMALDIGMGKRVKKRSVIAPHKAPTERSKGLPDLDAAETRRSWLGCYYMCSNAAMSLRRPLLIRWSPYADDCIRVLRTAPDALPSDRWLCQIVKAQHIGEMIGTEFAMDDPAQEMFFTDPNVQYRLQRLESELERWRLDGQEFASNPLQIHTKSIMNLYMHEVAMHNEHNIDDFRPPYNTTPIEGPPNPESMTQVQIDSLIKCLHSAHEAFDAFLSMDIDTLRTLPTHFFVRNSYAAVALIKLYTAIAAKGSKMASLFQPSDLKVEQYLDRLISTLNKVAEGGVSRVAYKFYIIFQMLRNWHMKRMESSSNRASREQSQTHTPLLGHSTSQSNHDSNVYPADNKRVSHPSAWPQHHQAQLQSGQRSGLQMLSDAAMNPTAQSMQNTSRHQSMADTSQHYYSSPPPPGGHIHQHQSRTSQMYPSSHLQSGQSVQNDMNSGGAMMFDPMMAAAYGMPPDQMSLMEFTSDELMAYGFGDEFMAMNFGFDQGGGWAI